MRWDLIGSSLGDSPKELGNSLGTRREIAGKKIRGLATRLPEVIGVCGTQVELNQLTKELVNVKVKSKSKKWRESLLRKFRLIAVGPHVPQIMGDDQWLTAGKLPRMVGKPPVPGFSKYV
ncbi:hypothetical protein B296_00044510 [Ensete ventricosum]|uniref:Uncharacterized protein n=1 Tax=Ensete ventricosum TaxID=4639 RepID=A0A426X4E4_ENSVE|nr:hypothetical protein B296_00044510 [Ensete ventricosum]